MYKDFPPIELTPSHIAQTIADYVSAAKMAIESGFDGIEIHGGNGYLVDQFLNSNVNIRTDSYGGDAAGRCRFLLELVEGIGGAIGEEKVAVRLTPWGVYNDMFDENRWETWSFLCLELGKRFPRLSYVHFVEVRQEELPLFEQSWGIDRPTDLKWAKEALGSLIPVISAGIWDEESIWGAVETGRVDGCVFARWFVSNPDLVERLRNGWKFSEYNRGKFYGPTSKREAGYTDYKTWEELEAEKLKES
jgi:2,4-dienoyl-CoA reductase-like NADH-dependent reductase (Old Yellow Enzyme family)